MIKSLLLLACATFMFVSSISADTPTPPCNPNCAVNVPAR